MQSFKQLAIEVDKVVEKERDDLRVRQEELDEKASLLATKENNLEELRINLESRSRQQDRREEELSRKEGLVRSDEEVREDRVRVGKDVETARKLRKEAADFRAEAEQKLVEVAKRELALSEKEKTYEQEVELRVMRMFTFGRRG